MSESKRVAEIIETIRKIRESNVSLTTYFSENTVPFSRAQYYRYCKILQKSGEEGLYDKREEGNNTKLTDQIKNYVLALVTEDRVLSSSQLQRKIFEQFGVHLSLSCLNAYRASLSLTRISVKKEEAISLEKSNGGEILTSLVYFTGILNIYTTTLIEAINEIKNSPLFEKNKDIGEDYPEARLKGQFTKEYNQIPSVRENRFKSIDDKIQWKNYSAMNIFSISAQTISRYNLALLCLPLVTSNSKISRVNRVKGNDLSFLCGYNYKDASLSRYIAEIKHLKASDQLIIAVAKFWIDFWRNESNREAIFVCYYIDGNTKPLWSSNRCYKGRVTMLGRVMNCLENVFIHDSHGHPLYFQTFQGHADLGRHALAMVTKLNEILESSSDHARVKRILVMDGGANGVKTLRAFDESDEYFITILDDNQIAERKFKHIREEQRYNYGKSDLVDCRIELLDSTDKGYVYECRAIIVKWDNGKQSVLVTDIPYDLLNASEVTKKYFDRWPFQEKQFRDAKNGVNIQRIVGYGKKIERYTEMEVKHRELCKTITQLKIKLQTPLQEMETIDLQLHDLYRKEKILREQSTVCQGNRILNESDTIELKTIERQIEKCQRQKKRIEKTNKEDFMKLRRSLKEEARIRNKDTVYKIDTELDQIMTCFKLSFINLCSLFLTKCMDHEKFELQTLFESIFLLEGVAHITDTKKTIQLAMNTKEPKLMIRLKNALSILNFLNIYDNDNRLLAFQISN